MHPCSIIYNTLPEKFIYGNTPGVCRVTGLQSVGVDFDSWVKDTFTDHGYLKPGTIISNEARFCFEERSPYIQQLTGRDKPQNFRTYSHFVHNGVWYLFDKGQKEQMLPLLLSSPDVCVISESGQKHLVFKHKPGTWQLEEITILPDIKTFALIHTAMQALSDTFTNDEISTGQYLQYRVIKFGIKEWKNCEAILSKYRGAALFDLCLFFSKIKYNHG